MLAIDRPLPGGLRTSTPAAGWLSPALHLSLAVCLLMLAERETSPAGDMLPAHQVPLAFIELGAGATGAGRFADDRIGPAPRARRPGDMAVAVPPAARRSWEAEPAREAALQESSIPIIPQASGLADVPGSITSVAVSVTTGGGPGQLHGSGSRDGAGVGEGPDRFAGSGGRGSGGNLEPPQLVHQVRPSYTTAAMQAGVRGIVVMDAVVEPDGSVGRVTIVRSLDATFGLDQAAVRAVRQWRFRAARRAGEPVAMVVTIELAFELR